MSPKMFLSPKSVVALEVALPAVSTFAHGRCGDVSQQCSCFQSWYSQKMWLKVWVTTSLEELLRAKAGWSWCITPCWREHRLASAGRCSPNLGVKLQLPAPLQHHARMLPMPFSSQ